MIVLYSKNNCPKCKILKEKLSMKNIEFVEQFKLDNIIERGFKFTPVLQVEEEYMDYSMANKWVNEQ